MVSQRVYIENGRGDRLAGILELPSQPPTSFAIFSHCFTCSKDLKAIVRISRRLAQQGIAVVRFDFTGLGDSSGDFSATNFETNLEDVLAVAQWLEKNYQPPKLLLGLSLGGAAMMVISSQLQSVQGLVTLAAPSCTRHLAEFLRRQSPEIESVGEGRVVIGGRSHIVKPQLLDSLSRRDLDVEMSRINVHHLIFHSPLDETLGFYHAEKIFQTSGGIKTFVTLDGADHLLLNRAEDPDFVADQIRLWTGRWMN
jgi:alpha/beta superfamily hydrolase